MSDQEEADFFQKVKDYVKKFVADIELKEVITLLIFGILIFFIFKLMFGGIFGVSLVVIENGPCPNSSMCPTYDKGDMFIINKAAPDKIVLGDVIVYESSSDGRLIIHRVVNVTVLETPSGTEYYYRVSGDNFELNEHLDSYDSGTAIPYEAVRGKTVMIIRKIGYVRLWLSESPTIRNILLVVVVGIGAYLILAPDKKTEEEKAKEEEEKKLRKDKRKLPFKVRFKEYWINTWKNTKKWLIELFTVKRQRIKLIIFCSLIILTGILVPVIDQAIRVEGATTGIHDITNVNYFDTYNVTENIAFFSFDIHYSHDGSYNDVLKTFYVEGIQNDEVLGAFRWVALYQPEVDGTIGGSLVFDMSEFDAESNLTIKITYDIRHRFGADQLGIVYEETFSPAQWI